MKLSLYFIFSMILSSCAKLKLKEIEHHVNLISDIYNFYKPSSVMFVHFDNRDSMSEMNKFFKIILMLSQKNIQTTTIKFEEIPLFRNYYDSGDEKVKHPLSVIYLTSMRAVKKFEEFSQALHVHKSVNLVIFEEIVEKPLKDMCLKPKGNPFKLQLDTIMLVKCYEENVIRQWYSVHENHTSFYEWARWNSKTGLILKANDTFYTRRANFYGKVLRLATVKSSSISHWKNGILVGYFGDLQHMLERSLNFTSKYVREEIEYGSFNEINQNWSGAIGLVLRKEVDLVVADFSMTSQRSKIIDFSTPLFFAKNVLYIKRPTTKLAINWTSHFKPFRKETWSSILLFMLVVSFLISCIDDNKESTDKLSRFSKNCFNIWRIYCQQGLIETPEASSFRLFYFSLFSSAFIISSIYSASLVSNFAIPTINIPFSSLEGFVKDGSYKLAVIRDSADSDFFENANDSILSGMNKLTMKKKELPLTIEDGFNMVCRKKVAFYISEIAAEIGNVNITCQLIKITTGRYDSVAMVMQKDSQYSALINYQLTKFRNNGVLNHLKSENFIKIGSRTSSTLEEFNKVDLLGILLLLTITTGGSILGMIIFFIERIYFYYKYEIKKKRFQTSSICDVMETGGFMNFKDQIKNMNDHKHQSALNLNILKNTYIKHHGVQTPIGIFTLL